MRNLSRVLLIVSAVSAVANTAVADTEASNVAHVVAGPYGRCYAKSVPDHIRDPEGAPRQQGRTKVFQVGDPEDVLVTLYNWFSQVLFVKCGLGDGVTVVRVGAWHRGHNARADHLAIAFYNGGKLLKRYSTLDITGSDKVNNGGLSKFKNVSVSVSHYTVFKSGPEINRTTSSDGPVFKENWVVRATTVDGRLLTFDIVTGNLR